MQIPGSLRLWFVAHFAIDTLFAVPLLLAPEAFLGRLGWTAVDPASPRVVGAALLAIGIQSWRGRHEGIAVYRAMLGLKIVWASAAIVGLAIAIARGAPQATFIALSVFVAFLGVWSHYAIRLRQLSRAPGGDETEGENETTSEAGPE